MRIRLPLRPLTALTIAGGVLLAACLLAGHFLFAGRFVSHSDDINALGKHSWATGVDFVRVAYVEQNGRVGDFITWGAIRLLINPNHYTPDDYPWWLLISLSAFFALVSVLLLASLIREATEV